MYDVMRRALELQQQAEAKRREKMRASQEPEQAPAAASVAEPETEYCKGECGWFFARTTANGPFICSLCGKPEKPDISYTANDSSAADSGNSRDLATVYSVSDDDIDCDTPLSRAQQSAQAAIDRLMGPDGGQGGNLIPDEPPLSRCEFEEELVKLAAIYRKILPKGLSLYGPDGDPNHPGAIRLTLTHDAFQIHTAFGWHIYESRNVPSRRQAELMFDEEFDDAMQALVTRILNTTPDQIATLSYRSDDSGAKRA